MRKYNVWVFALALTAAVGRNAEAQRRVTGRVTSADGEPLVSAGVNVQGTTLGTYTGEDGRFTLGNVPSGTQVLIVRRIGYRRAAAPLPATQDQLDIRLERDVLELEKQVITSSTGTGVSSVNAANAVAVVTGDQLNRAPSPTVENALQGKIPGAVITTNSGAPGGGSQIQLRGVTSVFASSSPLYVVDGVVVTNAAFGTGLNSVTNAGGGISNSQDQQVNRIADLNPQDIETIEVLKGASAGAIYGSAASNGVIIITTKRGAAGRPVLSVTQRVGKFTLAKKLGLRCFHSQAEAEAWNGGPLPTPYSSTCNDFEEQFYSGNGPSYETSVDARGGTGTTTYYVGGLAHRDAAIQRNTYYQKQSLAANIGQVIGSRLNLRVNNEFVHSLTERGISGNDNSPIASPVSVISGTPTFFDMRPTNGIYPRNPYVGTENTNIFQEADYVRTPEDVYRYIGSVNATFSAYASPSQTVDFSFLGGLDALQDNTRIYAPPFLYFTQPLGLPGTIVTSKTNSVFANLNLSGAHKLITSALTATSTLGLRQGRRESDQIFNQGRNVPPGVTDVHFGVVQAVLENQFLVKDFAYFAQEEVVAADERLYLTAGVNAERSSVNGDDKKLYAFPKYAASYRLPFAPAFVNEFKLRVAYGKAGNQPPYGFKFTSLPISPYDGKLGGRLSNVAGDPKIRPETSTETEGGFDAQFLGGRLATDVTLFRKEVQDLILTAAVAPTTGFTTRFLNGGALRNTGTEFGINIIPIQTGDFSWVSRTTYAKVSGRITRLDVPAFRPGVGSFGQTFGEPWIELGRSPSTVRAYDGCAAFSGTSCIARVSKKYESAPDFTMGFSNELNFGNLRLYGLVDWRKNGRVANLTNNYFDGTLLGADTTLSQLRLARSDSGYAVYLENGGFVKIRELSASYRIPTSVSQRFFTSQTNDVRVEVSARNLRTWTKYTGYDPEVSNFGNQSVGRFQDVTPYPQSRSVFFSISANF